MENKSTKPDDIKTSPANEAQADEKTTLSSQTLSDIKGNTTPTNAAPLNNIQPNQIKKDIGQSKVSEQGAHGKKSLEVKSAAQSDKPPKADKVDVSNKTTTSPKTATEEKSKSAGKVEQLKSTGKSEQPKPEPPPKPTKAPNSNGKEKIVYINLSELHPFKNHPFQVKQDAEMAAMVESVKDKGVTQPAIVRPRENGGYELVSGHRRHMASELSNFTNMPCIVRDLTDEQAITQMVEDNTNQRENILPSERANALKMQLEAIKRQGARDDNGSKGQRSNEIVADRNGMTIKQVQRYIKLTELVPELMKMVDDKKIAFTPAVELAFIKPQNQNYIAIAIEGNQSAPSLSQAQRLRELDQKNVLNPDMIDGIMMEEVRPDRALCKAA